MLKVHARAHKSARQCLPFMIAPQTMKNDENRAIACTQRALYLHYVRKAKLIQKLALYVGYYVLWLKTIDRVIHGEYRFRERRSRIKDV